MLLFVAAYDRMKYNPYFKRIRRYDHHDNKESALSVNNTVARDNSSDRDTVVSFRPSCWQRWSSWNRHIRKANTFCRDERNRGCRITASCWRIPAKQLSHYHRYPKHRYRHTAHMGHLQRQSNLPCLLSQGVNLLRHMGW